MKTIDELKNNTDKMKIFQDIDLLLEYVVTVGDLINAITQCLDDNQKLEVIKLDYFKKLNPRFKSESDNEH